MADHYAATMKGVLLSLCPDARLVDISHQIPPFSIHAAAYAIDQAAPYYPSGTVHVIVVDPGVGTARKALLLEALDQHFIAPDNGVLSMIAARDKNWKAFEIANPALRAPSPSSTFHGRDLFAPAAAAIAGGTTPADVGPRAPEIELLGNLNPTQTEPGLWRGMVLSVDHFGNIITSFRASAFAQIAASGFALRIGNHQIDQFRKTFGSAPAELCFAYFGSSGYIEIGMNQQSAAAFVSASPGDSVSLRLHTAIQSS